MIEITVNRNGANRRIDMAREFIIQLPEYKFIGLNNMVETLRSYERAGQFIVTDNTLTLVHYC